MEKKGLLQTGIPPPLDEELVKRCQRGEVQAFDQLVRRYQNKVFGLAYRMLGIREEAEDLAQDIFIKAFQSLNGFKGESRFSTWLYRIATNRCLNRLKEERRRNPGLFSSLLTPDSVLSTKDDPSSPHLRLEKKALQELVQSRIKELKGEHRLILVLRDIQGLSYEDIAVVLNLEIGTVRSRLHRARMELKGLLSPYLADFEV